MIAGVGLAILSPIVVATIPIVAVDVGPVVEEPGSSTLILEVRDPARAAAFYREVLGLGQVALLGASDSRGARLEGITLVLRPGGGDGANPRDRPRIETDDIVARGKLLLEAGLPLGPLEAPEPGVLAASGRDPDGNRFRLVSRVGPRAGGADDVAAARRAFKDWVAAQRAGDRDRVLAFYSDDPRFHIVEEGRAGYASKEAVAAALRGLNAQFETHAFRARDLRYEAVTPTLVLVRAEFEQELGRAEEARLRRAGTMTALLERAADGWKLLVGHTAARVEPA